MKFICLNRASSDPSYLKAVLNCGCGPNFIKNRPELFEQMIKEQGLEFWFRFWLTFSLKHNIKEFDKFEKEVPDWIVSICQAIHCNFVEVSSKEAARFCWNTILKERDFSQLFSTSTSGSKHQLHKKKMLFKYQQYADLTSEYIQMTFACALGEVFYKWLKASETVIEVNKKYWTVPKRYLDPEFKPGALEKFLVSKWGIKLSKFFGVRSERLPWIRQLLRYDKDILMRINDPSVGKQSESLMAMDELMDSQFEEWRTTIKNMKKEIQGVDEARTEDNVNRKHLRRSTKSGQDLNKKYYVRNVPCHSEIYLQSSDNEKKCVKSDDQNFNVTRKYNVPQYCSCTSFPSDKSRSQKSENLRSSFQFGYKIDYI